MNQRAQVIPLGTDSPRNMSATGTPADPRAERRDNSCCIFTRDAHPDTIAFARASGLRRGGARFDLEDIDWNRCPCKTEELRQSGGEVGTGGNGVEWF